MQSKMSIDDVTSPGKQWYFVQVYTGAEDSVVKHFKERIASTKSIADKFGQMLVPTEEVVEIRGGQKRKSQRKFYPGYVLIQMEMTDETWHFVKNLPGAVGFIGGQKPSAIPDSVVANILGLVEKGEKPKPKVAYEPGEMIRVIDGPFADFDAVVEDVNYEKNRLRVSVLIFGRSTPVELEFSQVEKV